MGGFGQALAGVSTGAGALGQLPLPPQVLAPLAVVSAIAGVFASDPEPQSANPLFGRWLYQPGGVLWGFPMLPRDQTDELERLLELDRSIPRIGFAATVGLLRERAELAQLRAHLTINGRVIPGPDWDRRGKNLNRYQTAKARRIVEGFRSSVRQQPLAGSAGLQRIPRPDQQEVMDTSFVNAWLAQIELHIQTHGPAIAETGPVFHYIPARLGHYETWLHERWLDTKPRLPWNHGNCFSAGPGAGVAWAPGQPSPRLQAGQRLVRCHPQMPQRDLPIWPWATGSDGGWSTGFRQHMVPVWQAEQEEAEAAYARELELWNGQQQVLAFEAMRQQWLAQAAAALTAAFQQAQAASAVQVPMTTYVQPTTPAPTAVPIASLIPERQPGTGGSILIRPRASAAPLVEPRELEAAEEVDRHSNGLLLVGLAAAAAVAVLA